MKNHLKNVVKNLVIGSKPERKAKAKASHAHRATKYGYDNTSWKDEVKGVV